MHTLCCSLLLSGEISATAYSCDKKKKFCLIFAVENFSIEITTYKRKLPVNYKTEKDEKRKKAKVLAKIKRTSALSSFNLEVLLSLSIVLFV